MKRKEEKPLEGRDLLFRGLQGGEVFPQKRKVVPQRAAQSLAGGVTVAGNCPIVSAMVCDLIRLAVATLRAVLLALEASLAGWYHERGAIMFLVQEPHSREQPMVFASTTAEEPKSSNLAAF